MRTRRTTRRDASPQDKYYRLRVHFLVGCLLLWCGLIGWRLVNLQVLQAEEIRQEAEKQYRTVDSIPALRGEILDAKGHTLAISRRESYLFADPSRIGDVEATVTAIADILREDKTWRRERVAAIRARPQSRYYVLVRQVPEPACEAIREADLVGIHIRKEVWRHYPNSWTGSHLLGFINREGVKEGLESTYDHLLAGKAGKRQLLRDGRGRRIAVEGVVLQEPVIGSNLHLTIDTNIQLFVEDAVRVAMKRIRAKNITVIVMDPYTGAIKALANMPDFNPNQFAGASYYERKNRAVVDVYEPGSAFKIITVAAALDCGKISMSNIYESERGPIKVFDKRIRNHAPYGRLSVSEVLWYSSNAGAVKIALTMEPETFLSYIRAFGIGAKTGIDLPAESAGILHPLPDWTNVSPYFLSMGHEVSATPLQMLVAASVVANGGKLVRPFVAARIVHPDGSAEDLMPSRELVQVIKPETAAQVAHALIGVVEHGTAKEAAIPGVKVFGKTGTAQRIEGRAYAKDKYNASFVGFFPAEKPRYGMIVVVHNPKGAKFHGGEVAAPIFSDIGRRIMHYDQDMMAENTLVVDGFMPNWPGRPVGLARSADIMPDLRGLGLRNLLYQSKQLGIEIDLQGSGRVVVQSPPPGHPVPESRVCRVRLKEG